MSLVLGRVTSRDKFDEIQEGAVSGRSIVQKYGSAAGLTTAGLKPISTSQVYKTPTAATALELVSSSIDDAPAGTGARVVRVWGLTDFNTADYEDVNLNGTTAVALTKNFIRVYRMRVIASGSYADDSIPSHNSTITLREVAGSATWDQIGVVGGFGLGSTETAAYSIPKGQSAKLLSYEINVEGSKTATILLFTRDQADVVSAAPYSPMIARKIYRKADSRIHVKPRAAIFSIDGPADIGFMGMSDSGTTDVNVNFELEVYPTP